MNTRISKHKLLPWLVVPAIFGAAAWQLHNQGRLWWCLCGRPFLWAGDIWSSHNSQHLLDPYTFTHALHGFAFCWLLALSIPRISQVWRLTVAIFLEALWEVFENTDFVIQRYREVTAALGYSGDSIGNSLGDIVLCGIGFMIAQRLGFRRAAVAFAVTEIVLLIWIRDSLILEILMLVYPIAAIKAWQMG